MLIPFNWFYRLCVPEPLFDLCKWAAHANEVDESQHCQGEFCNTSHVRHGSEPMQNADRTEFNIQLMDVMFGWRCHAQVGTLRWRSASSTQVRDVHLGTGRGRVHRPVKQVKDVAVSVTARNRSKATNRTQGNGTSRWSTDRRCRPPPMEHVELVITTGLTRMKSNWIQGGNEFWIDWSLCCASAGVGPGHRRPHLLFVA